MQFCCLLSSMVSDEKFAVIWITVPHVWCFVILWQDFSIFSFLWFDYDVSGHGFLWVVPVWSSLSFLHSLLSILYCWATREAGKWSDTLLNNSWIKKKKREITYLLGSNKKDNMSPKPCTQWVCMQRKVAWVKGICDQTRKMRNFPDSPVVKTLSFQCIGFDPWTGN